MGLSGSDGVILAVVLISVALSIYAISMCYYIVVYKPAQKERELKVKVTEYLVKNDLDRLNEQVIQQLDALHIQEDTDLNELDHIMRTLATIDHNTEMQRHERAVMMPDQQRVQLQHLQILSSAIKEQRFLESNGDPDYRPGSAAMMLEDLERPTTAHREARAANPTPIGPQSGLNSTLTRLPESAQQPFPLQSIPSLYPGTLTTSMVTDAQQGMAQISLLPQQQIPKIALAQAESFVPVQMGLNCMGQSSGWKRVEVRPNRVTNDW